MSSTNTCFPKCSPEWWFLQKLESPHCWSYSSLQTSNLGNSKFCFKKTMRCIISKEIGQWPAEIILSFVVPQFGGFFKKWKRFGDILFFVPDLLFPSLVVFLKIGKGLVIFFFCSGMNSPNCGIILKKNFQSGELPQIVKVPPIVAKKSVKFPI